MHILYAAAGASVIALFVFLKGGKPADHKAVEGTAFGAAIVKCIENHYSPQEHRLIFDPISPLLLPKPVQWALQNRLLRSAFAWLLEKSSPGLIGGLVCRTRFIDDCVKEFVRNHGNNITVIVLGAGLDARALRMQELQAAQVIEVDLLHIQEQKKAKLVSTFKKLPDNVMFISIDFNTQSLNDVLGKLQQKRPTLFIWEGVTQYITEEAVLNTLKFFKEFSQTEIVFTYVPKSVILGTSNFKGATATVERMKKRGHEWIFGMNREDIENIFDDLGIELLDDVGDEYYQTVYLKNRAMEVFKLERVVRARNAK